MLFSSTIFIFSFLPLVIFVYYILLKKLTYRNIFLLFSSLIFYAWGEPKFVLVMISSILWNWFFGLLIDKYRANKFKSKLIIVLMLVFNLGIIFIFKYLRFTLENLNRVTNANFNIPNIALPIGISFFTFQCISYVIDIYRENGKVQKNPLNVGLYISFFPQLIAGPIVRYETVADQIANRKENFEDFSKGVCRFIIGLSKKVLIANTLAIVADKSFSLNVAELSVSFAWLGAIAYTFQIFYDFSGYSDMAIGLGYMFGFKFNENFNYPYISKSVSEFWRRWHISLGTWFRDYLYFPLGGSRVKSKHRLVFNLFVVWMLTGVWHGAQWTFIFWGLYYFIIITLEKLIDFEKNFSCTNKLKFFRNIYVMLLVTIGWVVFRSSSITGALSYIKIMLGFSKHSFLSPLTILYLKENRFAFIAAILFSAPIAKVISEKWKDNKFMSILYAVGLILLFIVCTTYIIKGTYNPFIYFNF